MKNPTSGTILGSIQDFCSQLLQQTGTQPQRLALSKKAYLALLSELAASQVPFYPPLEPAVPALDQIDLAVNNRLITISPEQN